MPIILKETFRWPEVLKRPITGKTLAPPKGGDVMRQKIRLLVIFLALAALVVPLTAHAAAVGRFTLVTGQVDLLKQGKIPAIAAKVQDRVEPGDVIRTKTKAKAQLTMVDDSIITLAPESRLAIADYQYNADRGERRAVLRFFRGMMQTVVSRIIKTEEPDFIIETHTAVIGVRGSNPYFLLMPGLTSVYLPLGLMEVSSNNPKIPYQVMLRSMQYTQIPLDRQPFLPQVLTPEILRMLEKLMDTGLTGSGAGLALPTIGTGSQLQFPLPPPGSPEQKILQQTIPPVLVPHQQIPAPVQPGPSHPSGGGGGSP
jgi:hypothetical protein